LDEEKLVEVFIERVLENFHSLGKLVVVLLAAKILSLPVPNLIEP
jgi:hypothetical protein